MRARKGVVAEIRDPLLKSLPVGPDVEPAPGELLKEGGRGRASAKPAAGRTSIEEARRTRITGWLQVLGPGLVTGASDDDPSGIGTYAQVGSQFGLGLLWMALFTFPLMAAVQELCARIALQTGVGLGMSLRRKFPSWLVGAAILGLVVANTINIGADLGAVAAGGALLSRGAIQPLWLIVPTAALVLVLQLFATFRTIFSIFKWLTVVLFAYVLTGFLARPPALATLQATFVPHVELSASFITAMVAVLGTTISPYLFFWQASAEIDSMREAGLKSEAERRGVRRAELAAARTDIMVGMGFSQLVMYFIVLTSGVVLHGQGQDGVQTADQAARALAPVAGPLAFVLFSIGLIGTGLLAIPVLSGSAAYAVKEFFNWKGALSVKPAYRPAFYAVIVGATLAGVAMNFLQIGAIRALFITAVINGVVAPPLLVLIVLLGADRRVMKRQVSGRLSRSLTWVAAALMAASALAMLVTSLPFSV